MGHLCARLPDIVVWDDIGQMGQMNELLHVWGRILLEESRQFVLPRRESGPVPLGALVSDIGQKLLEEVLAEDQAVPAVGLVTGQMRMCNVYK